MKKNVDERPELVVQGGALVSQQGHQLEEEV